MEPLLLIVITLLLGVVAWLIWDRRAAIEIPEVAPPVPVPTRSDSFETAGDAAQDLVLEHPSHPGQVLEARVVDRGMSVLFARADAPAKRETAPAAVNALVQAAPNLEAAIKGGKVVQILNPEVLKAGKLLQAGDVGNLAAVHDGKKIAAQLRLGDPKNIRKVAGPLVVWQVAGAVTLQYYLVRINRQLGRIENRVRAIRQEMRNKSFGKVMAAYEGTAELEEQLATSYRLTENDLHRLVEEESRIDEAYHEIRKNLEDFRTDIDAVVPEFDSMDKGELRDRLAYLYDEGTGPRMYDAQMLVFAAAVRHKLNCLRVMVERIDGGDERVRLAERKAERELEAMKDEFRETAKAFELLNIPPDKLNDRWMWGAPAVITEAGGLVYEETTKDVRKFLKSSAPKVLPPFEPAPPLLLEVSGAPDGKLFVEHALLEKRGTSNKRKTARA
jgi:regulator of replication initiation timing